MSRPEIGSKGFESQRSWNNPHTLNITCFPAFLEKKSDLKVTSNQLVFEWHILGSQLKFKFQINVILFKYFLSLFFSATNGFQKNYSFSFANILPHGVCSVVYHPKHSLLIIGSLTSQGQRASGGLLMWKENCRFFNKSFLLGLLAMVVDLFVLYIFSLRSGCFHTP